jgi:hypothetical protein
MDELKVYGHAVRQYEGQGMVTVTAGRTYPCSFSVVQITTGSILFRLVVTVDKEEYGQAKQDFDLGSESLDRIEGTTKDGFYIVSDRPLYLTRLNPGTDAFGLTVFANRLTATNPQADQPPVLLRFAFVNFDYIGNEWKQEGLGGRLSLLRIRLPQTEVVFEQVRDYREALETIKAQHGIDVTCELECRLTNDFSHEDALEVANDLYLLLSIARGQFVNWIYYTAIDADGNTAFIDHRDRHVRPWPRRWLVLIEPDNLKDTANFLERSYPKLQDLKQELNRDPNKDETLKLIHAYLDARTAGFLETGALMAVSLLDFLRGHWLERQKMLYLLPERTFNKRKEKLREEVRNVLPRVFTDASEETLKLMSRHVFGFNWRPMSVSYPEFFASDWVGIPMKENDIYRFLTTRHELVHRAKFSSVDREGRTKEYFQVINLLDRVMLALLGYEGCYINCTSFNREDFQHHSTKGAFQSWGRSSQGPHQVSILQFFRRLLRLIQRIFR